MITTLELKAIKVFKTLSIDTYCFSGKIYVNGKPAGEVDNSGAGAGDRVFLTNKSLSSKMLDEFSATQSSLYGAGQYKCSRYDFESLCVDLVTRHIAKQDLKRLLKNSIVYVRQNRVYNVKLPPTADTIAKVKIKNGITETLNDLDFDKALELYLA